MILHLGCGRDVITGFNNHDPILDGWRFEDGLPSYRDEGVWGITISHALQNLEYRRWPEFLAECFRVLRPGGVLRITDDETALPGSKRHLEPWPGVKALTSGARTILELETAGFEARSVMPRETALAASQILKDRFCIRYRPESYVFWVEGVKPGQALPEAPGNHPTPTPSPL